MGGQRPRLGGGAQRDWNIWRDTAAGEVLQEFPFNVSLAASRTSLCNLHKGDSTQRSKQRVGVALGPDRIQVVLVTWATSQPIKGLAGLTLHPLLQHGQAVGDLGLQLVDLECPVRMKREVG